MRYFALRFSHFAIDRKLLPNDTLDHLKNLVIMAAADGSLTEQEIALLIDRCGHLGLQEEDLEKAIAFAQSGNAKMRLPTDREEQKNLLAELMRMMAADGHLMEVEKQLFAWLQPRWASTNSSSRPSSTN